ncbi:hypothetical protein ABFS83_06G147100 [Erythranthe nasuta]
MAPPLPTTAGPPSTGEIPSAAIALAIRGPTLLLLFISVIIIGTNTAAGGDKFNVFSAYSYMFATGIIGIIYTFTQINVKLSQMKTGNQSALDRWVLIDFYGDKVLSYMLATGTAAGFGLTVDLYNSLSGTSSFLNKANASASLLFFAFVFSAVSSVYSSYALPKKP